MTEKESAKNTRTSDVKQISEKRKQVSDMTARQPSETIARPPVPSPGAILEVDVQGHIGRQLRAVYDEVVREPVPDRFVKLLEELDRKREPGRRQDKAAPGKMERP